MKYIKIKIEAKGGITLSELNKSEIDSLAKSHEMGKWYVIALGTGTTASKALRLNDLPLKLKQKVNIALNAIMNVR